MNMKKIFESAVLGNLSVKNRLVRSATCEGIARPDGGITDEAYKIYAELAKGGVGLVITGFTSVALHDRYFGGMMRLCDDALIPQYKKAYGYYTCAGHSGYNSACARRVLSQLKRQFYADRT